MKNKFINVKIPNYTKGEELANTISHALGVLLGIAAIVLGIVISINRKNYYSLAGSLVFGITTVALYGISSIYHGFKATSPIKKVLRVVDHCAIFILIAGTYTPFALSKLRNINGTVSLVLTALLWTMAIVGIILNIRDLQKYKVVSGIIYLLMGWSLVFWPGALSYLKSFGGIEFLILGGVSFTAGALVYYFMRNKKYSHAIFHVLTLIGSAIHSYYILFYIL